MKHFSIFPLIYLLFANALAGQNTYFWHQTNGPEGGEIYQLAAQGNRLWAAGYGGLYYSDDAGENWSRHNVSPQNAFAVEGVCVLNDTLYALWRERYDTTSWEYNTKIMLARSGNQGETWQINGALVDQYDWFNTALLFPSGGSLVVRADLEKSYKTDNGGMTWDNLDIPNSIYPDWLVITPDYLSIMDENGALRVSDNCGLDWTTFDNFTIDIFATTGTFAHDSILIVGAGFDTLIISYDFGQTWQSLSIDVAPNFAVVFREGPADTLFCIANDIWYSDDGGQEWNLFTTAALEASPWTHLPDGTIVGPYYQGGVARFERQAEDWIPIKNGMYNQYVFQLASTGEELWANTVDSICFSTDNGYSWQSAGRRAEDRAFSACDGALYVVRSGILLRISPEMTIDTLMTIDDVDKIECYENQLVIRQDGTTTLFALYDPVAAIYTPVSVPTSMNYQEQNLIRLGSRLIYTDGGGQAYLSDDQGQNWTSTYTSSDPWINSILGIYVLPPKVLMILEQGVVVSAGGENWEEMEPNNWPIGVAPNSMIEKEGRWYAVFSNAADTPYIIESADHGLNWNLLQEQAPVEYITDLTWHQERPFIASRNSGVWRGDAAAVGQQQADQSSAGTFWPNPASNWVVVPPGIRLVSAHNALGKRMPLRMEDGRLDVCHWAAGVYFLQTEKDGYYYSVKIVVNERR